MKPHIKIVYFGLWGCRGGGFMKFGSSPTQAYERWLADAGGRG